MNDTERQEMDLDQIDREIAEKVMGWHEIMEPAWPYVTVEGKYPGYSKYGNNLLPKWHPTRNIGQAFVALESTGKDYLIGKKGELYFCEIRERTYPVPMDSIYQEAAILPEAICRAALQAVEEEL